VLYRHCCCHHFQTGTCCSHFPPYTSPFPEIACFHKRKLHLNRRWKLQGNCCYFHISGKLESNMCSQKWASPGSSTGSCMLPNSTSEPERNWALVLTYKFHIHSPAATESAAAEMSVCLSLMRRTCMLLASWSPRYSLPSSGDLVKGGRTRVLLIVERGLFALEVTDLKLETPSKPYTLSWMS
jgi:hypothetical protein